MQKNKEEFLGVDLTGSLKLAGQYDYNVPFLKKKYSWS